MNFEALGKLLEIPEKVRQNSYKKFTAVNEQVYDLIMASFLTDEYKQSYWDIWKKKQDIFLNK